MSPSVPTRIVVVAIGHPFGGDDAIGAAVLAAIADRWRDDPRVHCVELDGEPTRIVDAWRSADQGWLIDAMRSDDIPGTCREVTLDQLASPAATNARGTHAAGAADAVALGRALGVLPPIVRVFGVAGTSFEPGGHLTGRVRIVGMPCAVALVDTALRETLGAERR